MILHEMTIHERDDLPDTHTLAYRQVRAMEEIKAALQRIAIRLLIMVCLLVVIAGMIFGFATRHG